MARAGEDTVTAPVDLAIARIRAVYRRWNRETTVEQVDALADALEASMTHLRRISMHA